MTENMSENPFLAIQDEEDVEKDTIQFCWRDQARYCGRDCVAFDERSLVENSGFGPCSLINHQDRQSRALTGLAIQMKRQNDFYEHEDRAHQQRLEKRVETAERAAKIKELDRDPPKVES